MKYKSNLERNIAKTLDTYSVTFEYEPTRLTYQPKPKTYIPDLLDFIELLIKGSYSTKTKSLLNFVNPKPLATDSITEIMKAQGLYNTNWEWVLFEELNTKANRSNCVLSTKKLEKEYGFKLQDEKVAIKKAVVNNIR